MKRCGIHFRKNAVMMFVMIFLPYLIPSASAVEILGMKFGKLQRNAEISQIFETYQILPNHKYYISAWGNIPYAIIGIHENYTLREGLWKEVNLTPQLLRSWVFQMEPIYGYPPYGSNILDHKGNRLGVWYSSKQWTTVILEENNGVAVFTPEPPGFRGSVR
jgi:hypothetical protein